jgi:hypothetical protein
MPQPPTQPPHHARVRRWAWLVAALTASFGIGHANDFTLTVDMLPCENRLIYYPRLVSAAGQQYTQNFTARIVSEADRESRPATGNTLSKGNNRLDHWQENFEPFITVDWAAVEAPHLQIVDGSGTEVGWFRIPAYQPIGFAGGTGTVGDPYRIANAQQLQHAACLTGQPMHHRLIADIDLSGRRFLPIGMRTLVFRGGFDGGGHTIRNMTIDLPEFHNVGFIGGPTAETYVRNLTFDDPVVRGFQQVGTLIANARSSLTRFTSVSNVTIRRGTVRGAGGVGGMFGVGEDALITHSSVHVDLIMGFPNYHASSGSYHSSETNFDFGNVRRIGGFVGEGGDLSIQSSSLQVRITMDSRLSYITNFTNVGGLVGDNRQGVRADGIDATVFLDVTTNTTGSSSDAIGGLFSDVSDESSLSNTTAVVEIIVRAPPNNSSIIREIGAIAGHPERTSVTGVDVRGSITIDVRATESPRTIDVNRIGGAFGIIRNRNPVFLTDSHVDVDVIILGERANVRDVGGLVGEADGIVASNVRVAGQVRSDALVSTTNVGGLIGEVLGNTNQPSRTLSGVIYRGEGVRVDSNSTNVGVLWGTNGHLLHGTDVFWDRHRNGVSTFDENELGRPARSSELGDITWLTDNGFDPDAWCVTTEDGVSVPAVKRLTPACGGGNDGGNDGGVITLPTAPTTLTATPGNTTATLTWVAPTGVIDTYVIQSRTPGSNWRTQSTTPCDTPTCAIATNLTNAQPTDFRIAAENQAGRGPWSNVITITPGTTPTAPGSLTAAPGDATATLTWTPPTDDGGYPITSYTIEITNTIGGAWTPITGEPCSATCTTITDLANGTTVAFRIAATNTIGKGPWSNVTTTQPNPTPTAPTNLTATPGDAQVTLTWQAPSTGSNPTYQIDVSNDAGSIWTPANATPCNPASPTCAIIGGLTNGTPYTFRITATTTAGSSPAAGPVLATPQAPTDVPVITRVIPGPNRAWLIIATPTPTTTGHEISLDAGNTWQTITPHVGDRVIRITGLSNATTYPIQLRTLRTDGTRSPATPTITVMPSPVRIGAPELSISFDPESIAVTAEGRVTLDLLVTNEGSIPLNDLWLTWPNLPLSSFDAVDDDSAWFALDDWWYGENVDLAAGATHRVRVSLETQP